MKKVITFVVLFLLVLAAVLSLMLFSKKKVEAPTEEQQQVNPQVHPNLKINIKPGESITSPITISGEAKGWYFEASFPVKLLNAQKQVIFQGPAQAEADFITENFVPFSITITFPPQTAGSSGEMIFMKDNPSGLPQYDDQYVLPVIFK